MIGTDTITAVDATANTITATTAGSGTFQNCGFSWADGTLWERSADQTVPPGLDEGVATTTAVTVSVTTGAKTAAAPTQVAPTSLEQQLLGTFSNQAAGQSVEIVMNPDGTFTAIVRKGFHQLVDYANDLETFETCSDTHEKLIIGMQTEILFVLRQQV